MKTTKFFFPIFLLFLMSCVGDDIVDDFVDPQLRFVTSIETLAVGETFQLEAQFFNNVGMPENVDLEWSSSDDNIALVSEDGLLWARQKGEVTISLSAIYLGETVTAQKMVLIDEETVEAPSERMGSLRTTSSYNLQGEFVMSRNESGVLLSFGEDYFTDDVLPGLYIYLTNNPSTINGALEIGEVTTFKGAHEYSIDNVELNDFSHVLYFCKPFNVKVGDGAFQ